MQHTMIMATLHFYVFLLGSKREMEGVKRSKREIEGVKGHIRRALMSWQRHTSFNSLLLLLTPFYSF